MDVVAEATGGADEAEKLSGENVTDEETGTPEIPVLETAADVDAEIAGKGMAAMEKAGSLGLDVSSLAVVAADLYSLCVTRLGPVTTVEGIGLAGGASVTVDWAVATTEVPVDAVAEDVVAALPLTSVCFCNPTCLWRSRSASVSFCRICFCSSGPASGDVATNVDRIVAVISGELPVRVSWSTSRARSMPATFVDAAEDEVSLDTVVVLVVVVVVVCKIQCNTAGA